MNHPKDLFKKGDYHASRRYQAPPLQSFHDAPEAVRLKVEELIAKLNGNERACGHSDVIDGYWIETHTLGCRDYADEPEEQWVDSHYAIMEEYERDGISLVVDTSYDYVFVTITPQLVSIDDDR